MKQDSPLTLPSRINPGWRLGIVHSSYYKEEMAALVDGAEEMFLEAGIAKGNVRRFPVHGSFEIPLIGAALAKEREVDALVGLGIIVRGDTHHADLIAAEAARGIMDVQVRHGVPFAFEILYVDDIALVRSRLDKGREAAIAVLQSLATLGRIGS